VWFLAPVAAVIVAASFTAHRAIAPAVLRISIVGVALAWMSGAALDLLRQRGRPVRARAIVHIVACAVAIVSVGYIAITRDGLLDMLAETVQFGPGGH
jgi:nitric oxide reductase large subunit